MLIVLPFNCMGDAPVIFLRTITIAIRTTAPTAPHMIPCFESVPFRKKCHTHTQCENKPSDCRHYQCHKVFFFHSKYLRWILFQKFRNVWIQLSMQFCGHIYFPENRIYSEIKISYWRIFITFLLFAKYREMFSEKNFFYIKIKQFILTKVKNFGIIYS